MSDQPTTAISGRRRTRMMLPLLIGGFIALLNETLLNVAFPQLSAAFQVPTSTVQWLATGYMLVIGISMPVIAFLFENIPTNRLYMGAMLLFAAGTLGCGIAPNFALLLVFRMVQGIGTGMLIPIMMNTVMAVYPPEKRGSAMGMSLVVVVFAPAVGPTLSGVVLQNLNWRWLFFLVLPVAAAAMILAACFLKNVSRLSKPKIDVLSVFLSTIGFGGVIFGICSMETMGFLNATVLISLGCGAVGMVLYVRRQLQLKQPMLEMRTFCHPMFAVGCVILLVSFMVPFSVNIILPTFFQDALNLSPFLAGLAVLPGGLVSAVVTPLSGRLFDRIGAKPLLIAGFSMVGVAMFLLSHLSVATGLLSLVLFHMLTFVGIALINTPAQVNTLNQLPRAYYAHGVAITNTVQQIAAALGSSLFIGLMGAVQELDLARYQSPTPRQRHLALVSGVNTAFTAAFLLVLAALLISAFFVRARAKERT